jgi:hypothetical protein
LTGAPKGARVYLAIDDEAIAWIADEMKTPADDFLEVIRLRCLTNRAVDLDRVFAAGQRDYSMPPRYFAFLCAMVLAAHRMGDSEEGSPLDYFTHFNGILGIGGGGRSPGLEHGAEEGLWKDWALWLRYNGYQATAFKTGEHYYTYARSQALLRGLDKDRLWRHFGLSGSKYMGRLGKGELVTLLRADARLTTTHFPKHLRDLLDTEGKIGATRYDDLSDALYDTFDVWESSGRPDERTRVHQVAAPNTLRAGLYRTQDYLSGEVNYYLLPRQPRHIQAAEGLVVYHDELHPLISGRTGWFEPLSVPISLAELINGLTLPIQGMDSIRSLVLPAADFWILPPDPDDVTSGVYASWSDRPILGTCFVLLIRPNLSNDIEHLRSESLVGWNQETEMDGWIEYSGVMVLSDVWSEARVEHRELVNQLRPRTYMGVALRGGLRDTRSGAWLVGAGPEVIIYAFAKQTSVSLIDLSDNNEVAFFDSLKSGETLPIDWSHAGDFIIRVQAEGQQYERFVRILEWSSVRVGSIEERAALEIGDNAVFGAVIDAGV